MGLTYLQCRTVGKNAFRTFRLNGALGADRLWHKRGSEIIVKHLSHDQLVVFGRTGHC